MHILDPQRRTFQRVQLLHVGNSPAQSVVGGGTVRVRATQKLRSWSRGPRVEGDKVERGRDVGAGGPPPTRPQRWGPPHVPGKAAR